MNIGVVLSGCDLGGVSAFFVLQQLRETGISPAMISACCVPAATAMLFARGRDTAEYRRLAEQFLHDARENDLDAAIAGLSAALRPGVKNGVPLAVNAVDVATGNILTFTNDFVCKSEQLSTTPLGDAYDALSATISLVDGLGRYRFGGHRLGDYCCWYGCPVYPLKMAGITKIISIAFLPEHPETPYEVMVRHMTEHTGNHASIHIPIEFPGRGLSLAEYESIASDMIEKCKSNILLKTLL